MSRISYEAGFLLILCNIIDILIYLDFFFEGRGKACLLHENVNTEVPPYACYLTALCLLEQNPGYIPLNNQTWG